MKSFHGKNVDNMWISIYTYGMTREDKGKDHILQKGNVELFKYLCYWSMIPEDDRASDEKTLKKFAEKYKKPLKTLYEWVRREDFKKITEQAESSLAHYYLTRIKGNIVRNSRRDAGSQKLGLMYFAGWVPKEGRDLNGTVVMMTVAQANKLKELAVKELAEGVKLIPEAIDGATRNDDGGRKEGKDGDLERGRTPPPNIVGGGNTEG